MSGAPLLAVLLAMPALAWGQAVSTTTAAVSTATAAVSTAAAAVSTATAAPALAARALVESATVALTTPYRAEPPASMDLPGLVLGLPGALVELAFTPLAPLITLADEYHLHERLFDLVTNDEHTFAAVPVVEVFSSSGVGFGGAMVHNDPLGSPNLDLLVVLARLNGDVSANAGVQRRFSSWNSRTLGLSASYSLDHDYRYYGLGPRDSARRLLRIEAIDVSIEGQVLPPGESDFRLYLEAAFARRETTPGVGDEPGLQLGDVLEIPGGFLEELHYPSATVRFEYDTRDSRGRTTRGMVAALEGKLTADVEGAETSVFRGTARLALFAPVLPLHRVLFIGLGASAAVPLGTDEVPLHELVHLGGASTLRGYDSDRFSGAVGWWGTAEYRYKVFQEADTGHGLSGVLFFDVGAAGRDMEELLLAPVRWSSGFAFRVETNLFLLGRFQLGFSPEGVEVSVAIGELL